MTFYSYYFQITAMIKAFIFLCMYSAFIPGQVYTKLGGCKLFLSSYQIHEVNLFELKLPIFPNFPSSLAPHKFLHVVLNNCNTSNGIIYASTETSRTVTQKVSNKYDLVEKL